jgi:virginiamycin A acetyltransferase
LKHSVKIVLDVIAAIVAAPLAAGYYLFAMVFGATKAFPGWSQLVSLFPGMIGIYLRRAFYRYVFPQCGKDACISFGTTFSHPSARLGRNVYIGVGCMVGDATLEDDVLVGSHVSIINGRRQHGTARLDVPVRQQAGEYPRVTIGRDSWIGDRAIVTESVGEQCIVGAGAVVTKPVPDYAIVVGNPARIAGYRKASDSTNNPPAIEPSEVEIV